jgi:hypothetical protein
LQLVAMRWAAARRDALVVTHIPFSLG